MGFWRIGRRLIPIYLKVGVLVQSRARDMRFRVALLDEVTRTPATVTSFSRLLDQW
jgi:hypothetical protein